MSKLRLWVNGTHEADFTPVYNAADSVVAYEYWHPVDPADAWVIADSDDTITEWSPAIDDICDPGESWCSSETCGELDPDPECGGGETNMVLIGTFSTMESGGGVEDPCDVEQAALDATVKTFKAGVVVTAIAGAVTAFGGGATAIAAAPWARRGIWTMASGAVGASFSFVALWECRHPD